MGKFEKSLYLDVTLSKISQPQTTVSVQLDYTVSKICSE